jgi:hypothetical protein
MPGTGDALNGGERRDTYLDTLARMLSLQQGQEMTSQQPKIAWSCCTFPDPAEGCDHLIGGDGTQSGRHGTSIA